MSSYLIRVMCIGEGIVKEIKKSRGGGTEVRKHGSKRHYSSEHTYLLNSLLG